MNILWITVATGEKVYLYFIIMPETIASLVYNFRKVFCSRAFATLEKVFHWNCSPWSDATRADSDGWGPLNWTTFRNGYYVDRPQFCPNPSSIVAFGNMCASSCLKANLFQRPPKGIQNLNVTSARLSLGNLIVPRPWVVPNMEPEQGLGQVENRSSEHKSCI